MKNKTSILFRIAKKLFSLLPKKMKNRIRNDMKNIFVPHILSLPENKEAKALITTDIFDKKTYTQSGEDAILAYIFFMLSIPADSVTYIDLGACYAKSTSNTYYFYTQGANGVLVEANTLLANNLVKERSRDVVLNNVVDIHDDIETDFYILNWEGLSTSSKEDMENSIRTHSDIEVSKIVNVMSISVNTIIKKYFNEIAPTYISIDIEGTSLDILKSIDLKKFRPLCIIIETIPLSLYLDVNIKEYESMNYLLNHNYAEYAFTGINSIFIDKEYLEMIKQKGTK